MLHETNFALVQIYKKEEEEEEEETKIAFAKSIFKLL